MVLTKYLGKANYQNKIIYIITFVHTCMPRKFLVHTPRFGLVVIAQGRLLWLPEVDLGRFSRFLRFWEGLVI